MSAYVHYGPVRHRCWLRGAKETPWPGEVTCPECKSKAAWKLANQQYRAEREKLRQYNATLGRSILGR